MSSVPLVWFAHAFGQTYTLPVPLWLFLFGAGATVALSFLIIGLLADKKGPVDERQHRVKKLEGVVEVGRFLGVLLLAMMIIAGLAGPQDSMKNFSVTALWIIFLLGFTYLVAIFGNIWEFVNPFRTLADGIESASGSKLQPLVPYPQRLGYWPAFATYFALIWIELIGKGFGTTPYDLSLLLIGYTFTTLLAVYCFGKESWFTYGELFSVFFGLVGKVSPIKVIGGMFSTRRLLAGLTEASGATFSLLLFIIFMLASTGFDGLKETVLFGRMVELLPPALANNFAVVGLFGLLLAPLVLLAVYLPFIALMKRLVPTDLTVLQLAYRFAFSLVPIAVAYHAAHYFTMLLISGQAIIPELSDPFGSGLNVFGTAGYQPTIGFLSASFVWYAEVALIVLGHIGAVYAAHMEALKLFGSRQQALVSQIPMVVVMVLYTAGSLWIIAQPIAV